MKKEFCIMPPSQLYQTERFPGLHRHEVFFGSNRKNSIEYGLVVFLTPEQHNMSNQGIHFNRNFDLYIKKIAQKTAMQYYNWDISQWREIFGKSYL